MGYLREDRQEEGICPICQECLKEAVRTDCGHLFCRACLAQHLEKASASGVRSCPLCRKPCSEGVLGAGYTCDSPQKKAYWFCEESRRLLCMECRVTPEHKSHCELPIENAISHYKERTLRDSNSVTTNSAVAYTVSENLSEEFSGIFTQKRDHRIIEKRLNRRIRRRRQLRIQEEILQEMQADHGTHRLEAELEQQPQTRRQLDAPAQQRPDQRRDVSAELSRSPGISRALLQFSSLVTDPEGMAKKLDTSLLKDAGDLLNRSAPEQLEAIYPNLEERINESLVQPSSAALTCSSLGHLISDSPHPPGSPSPNLSSLPLGLPDGPSDLPSPEHDLHSSSPEL